MPYNTYTLANLEADLEAKWDSVPFWTAEEARLAINEACRIWNMLTGMWKRTVHIPTVANTPWLTLPSTMVQGMRVTYAGFPLSKDNFSSLSNLRPNWQAETIATGGVVPARPKVWAPAGLTLIAYWPADTASGNLMTFSGVRSTPQLVNLFDTIDLGAHEHGALLNYSLHYAAFKASGSIFSRTLKHYQAFIAAAAEQNTRIRASALFTRIMRGDLTRQSIAMMLRPKDVDYPSIPRSQDNPYINERKGTQNSQTSQQGKK